MDAHLGFAFLRLVRYLSTSISTAVVTAIITTTIATVPPADAPV